MSTYTCWAIYEISNQPSGGLGLRWNRNVAASKSQRRKSKFLVMVFFLCGIRKRASLFWDFAWESRSLGDYVSVT